MNDSNPIHIALCADEGFALPMGVCLTSLLENNKENNLHIHILTAGFAQSTIEKINQTGSIYGRKIEIHLIDDEMFSGHPLSTSFPKSIYFRYLLPSVLDNQVKKVIYIDCDTVVLSDISALFAQDIDNFAIGAVPDANTDDIIERNRIEIYDGPYLNSGVLLINLEYWRKENVFRQLTEFILKYPEKCLWPDQDALNVILHNKIKWLKFNYNFQLALIAPVDSYRMHADLQQEVIRSFPEICILHFSSWSKPWVVESKLPLSFIWRFYHNLSVWRNIPLKTRGFRYRIKLKLGLVKPDFKEGLNPSFSTTMTILKEKFAQNS